MLFTYNQIYWTSKTSGVVKIPPHWQRSFVIPLKGWVKSQNESLPTRYASYFQCVHLMLSDTPTCTDLRLGGFTALRPLRKVNLPDNPSSFFRGRQPHKTPITGMNDDGHLPLPVRDPTATQEIPINLKLLKVNNSETFECTQKRAMSICVKCMSSKTLEKGWGERSSASASAAAIIPWERRSLDSFTSLVDGHNFISFTFCSQAQSVDRVLRSLLLRFLRGP